MPKKTVTETVLNDRERILSLVVRGLASTQLMMAGRVAYHKSNAYTDSSGYTYVHFAYDQDPVAGDLVLAHSSRGTNPWLIGWYVGPLENVYGGAVIREIGTGVLCNYSNESFIPIRGMKYTDLLEGNEREFYLKVLRAIKDGEGLHVFGGIKFEGSDVIVTIRQRWMSQESLPYTITLPFHKKMSVKRILSLLREGGFGTREFEKRS
jgi:hypothetical protein